MGCVWKSWRYRKDKNLDRSCECGISPFTTGPNDPFLKCCEEHDLAYLQHEADGSLVKKEVDQQFYTCCLKIAGQNRWLKLRALGYYAIVKGPIGWIAWLF